MKKDIFLIKTNQGLGDYVVYNDEEIQVYGDVTLVGFKDYHNTPIFRYDLFDERSDTVSVEDRGLADYTRYLLIERLTDKIFMIRVFDSLFQPIMHNYFAKMDAYSDYADQRFVHEFILYDEKLKEISASHTVNLKQTHLSEDKLFKWCADVISRDLKPKHHED
jgi:hypothetical protein